MKNKIHYTIIILLLSIPIVAQYPSYQYKIQNDSLTCLQDVSIYHEFQKQNLHNEAVNAWIKAYNSCKGSKKVIYQDGIKLIKKDIESEKNEIQHKTLIDSMMNIYNERIKYFGQADYVKGRQAIDLFSCDRNRIDEAYNLLEQSLIALQEKSDPAVIAHYMLTTKLLYKHDKLTQDKTIHNYLLCLYLLENKIEIKENKNQNTKHLKKVMLIVDEIFAKIKLENCTNLVSIVNTDFQKNKNKIKHILNLQHLLKIAKCSNANLYFEIGIQIQKIKPTNKNAKTIAKWYLKHENYKKAIDYFTQAATLTSKDDLKADNYNSIASIQCYKLHEYKQAKQNILKSLQYNANKAKTYILLGDIYALASSKFSEDNFVNASIIWIAIDKYNKAKQLNKQLNALINQKISYYKKYLPSIEEAFMHTYKKGDIYKIGSWINEETIVR